MPGKTEIEAVTSIGASIRAAPGTYALILKGSSCARIQVGIRREIVLEPGYYIYVGSAFGPGGVRARISRHLRMDKARHWHIDYLTEYLEPFGVWYSHAPQRLEHAWAKTLGDLPDMSPVPGFGCSDCRCHSHLFWSARMPDFSRFADLVGKRGAIHEIAVSA